MDGIQIYLAVHGVTTVGSLIAFLIRNEHRLTRLETKQESLEKQHNALTSYGTKPHQET